MASVIYPCPRCGTELRDDGDLWCPECEETNPASAVADHPDFDGAPLGDYIQPGYEGEGA